MKFFLSTHHPSYMVHWWVLVHCATSRGENIHLKDSRIHHPKTCAQTYAQKPRERKKFVAHSKSIMDLPRGLLGYGMTIRTVPLYSAF
jgi:tmRNA-binding protein